MSGRSSSGNESKDHTMIGVKKDLWRLFSSIPPTREGSLRADCKGSFPKQVLNISREGVSASLGSLFQCFVTLKGNKLFLIFRWKFLFLNLFAAPCPVIRHHWKESGSILLVATPKILACIYKVPSQSSLLQAKQLQVPQPFLITEMIQFPDHPDSILLDPLQ